MAPYCAYDPLHLVPQISLPLQPNQPLDSRGAFVVHARSAVYIWIGEKCASDMTDCARTAASHVIAYRVAEGPVVFVKQGEETPQFWLVFETEQDRLRTPEIANEGSSVEGRPVVSLPKVPNDIIFGGILSRLPVRSLLRLMSVSKYWKSMIASDPHLALDQMKRSVKSTCSFDRRRILIWDLDSVFLQDKKWVGNSFFTKRKITCPVEDFSCYLIVAACDGLVCLRKRKMDNVILFWNPLTGETKRVSEPPVLVTPLNFSYGLGYDSSSDDYKLVRICTELNDAVIKVFRTRVRVYSLRHNSWKQVEDFPGQLLRPGVLGVFFNGALYWTTYDTQNEDEPWKVTAFDLAKEEFSTLEVHSDFKPKSSYIEIRLLDEKLCLYYPPPHRERWEHDRGGRSSFNFWLINEHDNSETWSGYAIKIPSCKTFTPLCLLKNDEEVSLAYGEGKIGVYNLEDHTLVRDLHIPGIPKDFEEVTFTENLISPDTYNGLIH